MQDVIPPKKRSIRDIPLPEGKNRIINDSIPATPPVQRREIRPEPDEDMEPRVTKAVESEMDEAPMPPVRRFNDPSPKKKFSKRKIIFFTVLAFALIFVILLVSRQSAKIYIYAKEMTQSSNLSIGLNYTPIEITSEKTATVKDESQSITNTKKKNKDS